jgi:hypothetical protein
MIRSSLARHSSFLFGDGNILYRFTATARNELPSSPRKIYWEKCTRRAYYWPSLSMTSAAARPTTCPTITVQSSGIPPLHMISFSLAKIAKGESMALGCARVSSWFEWSLFFDFLSYPPELIWVIKGMKLLLWDECNSKVRSSFDTRCDFVAFEGASDGRIYMSQNNDPWISQITEM